MKLYQNSRHLVADILDVLLKWKLKNFELIQNK